jgi:hypothetical protein
MVSRDYSEFFCNQVYKKDLKCVVIIVVVVVVVVVVIVVVVAIVVMVVGGGVTMELPRVVSK